MNLSRFTYLLLATGLLASPNLDAQESLEIWTPVKEVLSDAAKNYLISVDIPFCFQVEKGSTAQITGRWEDYEPERTEMEATARVQSLEEAGAVLKVKLQQYQPVYEGDLVLLSGNLNCDLVPSRTLELAKNAVLLTDIYGTYFYDLRTALMAESDEIDVQLLDAIVADIKMVGAEMATQGEEDPVVSGPLYAGSSLFSAMQETRISDVQYFLDYVVANPVKYRGHSWKVSEVYATWLVNGAPGVDIPTSLESLLRELNETQNTHVGSPECEGKPLIISTQSGTLNGVAPTASMDHIREEFPCYTGETEEGADYNCGGGIFFLDHDFYFYTFRDLLEVRDGFQGTLDIPLLTMDTKQVENALGLPDFIPDYSYQEHWLYKRTYGTLRVSFHAQTHEVMEIGIHYQPIEGLDICW